MGNYDFTFDFEKISDTLKHSKAHIYERRIDRQLEIQASINDWKGIGHRGLQLSREASDLIDLAVSIYVADRHAKGKKGLPRSIRVRLPIRSTGVFLSPSIQEDLNQILFWFTADNWFFEFSKLQHPGRRLERQINLLPPSRDGRKTEVALWSGGLDALAGLCNRTVACSADRFVLVGAGANRSVWELQNTVYQCLNRRVSAELDLVRLHIELAGTEPFRGRKNKLGRARGVVFMLLGSAYALLEQQEALAVYENGPGALNLPFRASEVGLDHGRGVHPLSLHKVGQFISALIGKPFEVRNPFLLWTKAEMCKVFGELNLADVAMQTRSCDRSPRSTIRQCGTCSSCILRRQAFLASAIYDHSRYLLHHGKLDEHLRYQSKSHLPYMLHQAAKLRQIFNDDDAWAVLARMHPSIVGDLLHAVPHSNGLASPEYAHEIVNVLRRYANEWLLPSVQSEFEPEYEEMRIS